MIQHAAASDPLARRRLDDVWRDDRRFLLGFASRLLGDPNDAEDVVQEAFGRLARIDFDDLEDPRAWITVVVRRLCVDHGRSAHVRRETVGRDTDRGDGVDLAPDWSHLLDNPAERATLDEQVQLALAVVLDRLTPAERTTFVLHDVFAFSFTDVAEIVGRTPAACRQLASRARRSIRTGAASTPRHAEAGRLEMISARFIDACKGGDIAELMCVLDPDVEGVATLIGHGPVVHVVGRSEVAGRLRTLFGPGTTTRLLPVTVEEQPGILGVIGDRVAAVVKLHVADGRVDLIRTFLPSRRQDGGRRAR